MKKLISISLIFLILFGLVGCYKSTEGWVQEYSQWYYYSVGQKATNTWIDDKYYVDDNGAMLYNTWIDGKYLLGPTGELVTNTWINQKYPIYNTTYKKYTGETKGGIYYINSNSEVATNTWIDDKYYVDTNGNLVTDTWVDNKYYVDSNGEYVPNKAKPNSNNNNKSKKYDIENVVFEGSQSHMLSGWLSRLEDSVNRYIAHDKNQKMYIEEYFDLFVKAALQVQENIQYGNYWDKDAEYRDLSKAKEIINFYRSLFTFLR